MSTQSRVEPSEVALPSLADQIVKTPGTCGGKARIAGTRIRVQDIYVWHELQGQTVDQIVADFPQLTHAQVHAALAYFFSRPNEIHNEMADGERFVEEMKRQTGLGPLEQKLAKMKANAANDQVSS
jgi:uncharacterized protein (DUF433 family)